MEEKRQNRIAEALALRGMKQVELCEKAGVNKSSLSHWLRQHWQPKQKQLLAMAKVLEVSETWLAGYDEEIASQEDKLLINIIRNNESIASLVYKILELNESQFTVVENVVTEFSKANEQG